MSVTGCSSNYSIDLKICNDKWANGIECRAGTAVGTAVGTVTVTGNLRIYVKLLQ